MLEKRITRRAVLLSAASAGSILVIGGCSKQSGPAAASACVDPDQVSDAHRGLRTSMNYTDASGDPAKVCAGCAFFRANESSPSCGTCEVLLGPVDAKGYCESWSRKA